MNRTFNFSFEDILGEIGELSNKNKDGFTVTEMSDAIGRSNKWCQDQVKKGIKLGKIKFVGRAMRPRMDGILTPVPIYTIVDGEV